MTQGLPDGEQIPARLSFTWALGLVNSIFLSCHAILSFPRPWNACRKRRQLLAAETIPREEDEW